MVLKRYQGALEERFVVAHWEQRGAGKSYAAGLSGPLSLEEYDADVDAVTEHLQRYAELLQAP